MTNSIGVAVIPRFFLLNADANRDDLESVDDYDIGRLSVSTFWTGKRYEGEDLSAVVVRLTDGNRSACLGNPMSWLIVSPACVKQLADLICDDVQILPLRTQLVDGSFDNERYVIVNALRVVDAIHSPLKPKRHVGLVDLVVDVNQIPTDCHIFRLKHNETAIVVSSDVVRRLSDNNLQGFVAIPVDVFVGSDGL